MLLWLIGLGSITLTVLFGIKPNTPNVNYGYINAIYDYNRLLLPNMSYIMLHSYLIRFNFLFIIFSHQGLKLVSLFHHQLKKIRLFKDFDDYFLL